MQVSSEKAKDSSIQDPFTDGSFISPPKTKTSGEPLDTVQPSKVSSGQKLNQKETLSPNPVTSDLLPTSEEHDEDGATRPLTRTARTPSPEDEPGRAGTPLNPDTSPSPDNLRQESKHPQGTSTAEAGSLRVDSHSNGDISTAGSGPQDSTKGNPNRPPAHIINNSPTDPAAVANAGGDPGLGSSTASSTPSPHQDPSPNGHGNPYPQPQTSPLASNADGGSAPTPASASTPLLQPPAPEAPPSSIPSHSNPTTPQIDPSASKPASPTTSLKDVDPSLSGQGRSSLIEFQSQSQSPAPPAPGQKQAASTAQAVQVHAKAAFQQYENYKNTNTNTNTDPNSNTSSTPSGRRGGGKAAQLSSSSPSRGGGNSNSNASSVLPFQNGGERKRIGVLVWIVGLVGWGLCFLCTLYKI